MSDGQGRNIDENRAGADNGSNVRNEGSNVFVRSMVRRGMYFLFPFAFEEGEEKKTRLVAVTFSTVQMRKVEWNGVSPFFANHRVIATFNPFNSPHIWPITSTTSNLQQDKTAHLTHRTMATRSRTLLFLQFRNSYSGSHAATLRQQYNQQQQQQQQSSLLGSSTSGQDGYGDYERVGLMDSAETTIELMMLPPKWYIVSRPQHILHHG